MTKIIRLSEVVNKTGLSRSSIYAFIDKNNFPKQLQLGKRSVGWVEEEIDNWIDVRIEERQKK